MCIVVLVLVVNCEEGERRGEGEGERERERQPTIITYCNLYVCNKRKIEKVDSVLNSVPG